MSVNHHGGVGNGKIGKLHRTDTGAANLENRHINVRPELDIVNGQPVFAGARAGAFCKAGGYLLCRCTFKAGRARVSVRCFTNRLVAWERSMTLKSAPAARSDRS